MLSLQAKRSNLVYVYCITMKQEIVLHHLEELAERLSVEISYEDLKKEGISFKGGSCKIKGKERIIISRNLTAAEKVDILAIELSRYDIESVYIPPAVKELLVSKK